MKLIDDLDAYAFRKGWPRWACIFVPLFYPGCWPVIVYRYGSWVVGLKSRLLRWPLYVTYFPMKRLMELLTTIDLSEHAVIDGGFYIAHVGNIVVGHHTRMGPHASIHQGVTIGGGGSGRGFPVIGDNVYFGAGAKIIGPVKIGNNAVIGANAVVTHDVPDNAVVGGVPAQVLSYRSSNEFVHFRGKGKNHREKFTSENKL